MAPTCCATCFFVCFVLFFLYLILKLEYNIHLESCWKKIHRGLIFNKYVIPNRNICAWANLTAWWIPTVKQFCLKRKKKTSQEKTSAVWLTLLTHEWAFSCCRLYLLSAQWLRINLFNEPCCGVGWTYSWYGYLIKTVPLGSNWCYLGLG